MEFVDVIRNTKEAERQFSKEGWGHGFSLVTAEQLEKVITGEYALAVFDGEYTHMIALCEPK